MIKREDIEEVRSRARIDEIVGEHVQLRSAGSGSMKGLCPFHDERTPSFHVRPDRGLWHCFGCGEGGDVIDFVKKINHLDFVDAVEYLAGRLGVQLHYEQGQRRGDASESSLRRKAAQANEVAQQYFAAQLRSEQAVLAQRFLQERGFDAAAAQHFGLGYAPNSWDSLLRHLRSRGFTDFEIEKSGLTSKGQRGMYDRFRGRLVWPIRDITGQTVGFGARRLSEEDQGPKYLNTPETVLYKKSHVLYGLDLAKKSISRKRQIIIVEGYTDVMACHLAGFDNAVATCGTAFGSGHVQIARRLLGDSDSSSAGVILSSGKAYGGQVIFTFDGDEAGQKAAMKAFEEDQKFAAQTFVCVEPSGKDPCEVRLAEGDAGVARLIDSKKPLFAFVIQTILKSLDLTTAEGRVNAVRAVAPIIGGIKDFALRKEYVRQLSGWVNMPVADINQQMRQGARSQHAHEAPPARRPRDLAFRIEEQALEAMVQRPFDLVDLNVDAYGQDLFAVPQWKTLWDAMRSIGGIGYFAALNDQAKRYIPDPYQAQVAALARFGEHLQDATPEAMRPTLRGLAVAPLPQDNPQGLRAYARGAVAAVMKMSLNRTIGDLQAKLARSQGEEQQRVFQQMMDLEKQKSALKEQVQNSA